jgi:hypothetical protein
MCIRRNFTFLLILLFTVVNLSVAQTLRWTGAVDTSFFNENNWTEAETGLVPAAGTVDPGVAINKHLIIEYATANVGGSSGITSDILMGTGNLTIRKSTLKLAAGKGIDMGNTTNILIVDSAVVITEFLNNATTTLAGDSKVYLIHANPFNSASTINITSEDAWIFASKLDPATAVTTHFPGIKINGNAMVDMTNARISQYYYGSAIAAYNAALKPLRVFDSADLNGNHADIAVQTIYSGASIPAGMNDRIVSFKLKKGYMVTLAIDNDGTGMSKVYIASESDLIIPNLPAALSGNVSFIRVVPWSWTTKKGFGKQGEATTNTEFYTVLNPKGSWYYDWGLSNTSRPGFEYAAMGWGKTSLDTPTKRNVVINKRHITHIMSFNEADNCNDQSGKFGSLCNVDTAALWHQHAMKVGVRIVSPSCTENQDLVWLKNVNTRMVPEGTRMDVIGMHWYDWDGYLNNKASDANSIFNRFKTRVAAVYNYYKMPIWITEFNANKNRSKEVQDAFLQLALPWLETVSYVERYAYFQPNGGNGDFLDANGNLTSTGTIYMNHISTPSISEENYNKYGNNLEGRMSIPTSVTNVFLNQKELEVLVDSQNKTMIVDVEDHHDYIRMVNIQGVLVKKFRANTTVDVSRLKQGVYILAASGVKTQKLLLN